MQGGGGGENGKNRQRISQAGTAHLEQRDQTQLVSIQDSTHLKIRKRRSIQQSRRKARHIQDIDKRIHRD